MTTKTTTRTKKRNSRARRPFALALVAALLAAGGARAQDKPKPGAAYAVVAGTVFRDSGFAQPGVNVVLALKSRPNRKLQEQVSSPRGEFAFRVTPGPNVYTVTASLKGFETVQKDVEISSQEQFHVTLLLVPASNP